MITFSFSPRRKSTFPSIAASVSTFVVSWNEAAEMKLSVDNAADVMPSSTGSDVAGSASRASTVFFPRFFRSTLSSLTLSFASSWPVAAIVAENGAVALIPDGAALRIEYAQDEATRSRNAERLRRVAQRLQLEIPSATLARDSAGRVTDIAVDHSEFAHLDAAAIGQVVALMQAEGMTATVSSIHVNGWFGSHTKLSAAHWMLQRLYGRELAGEIGRWIYVGDSTNDQAMFGAFALSVGVANLRRFAAELHTWPAYITAGERGEGFAEVARALLAAREAA